jgi:dinuclear metal center YbgI/SA1388 family protein
MKLKDLCSFLDSAIPLSFQEEYDNSGLQVGLPEREVKSALICVDVTDDVLDEASYAGCDVIISHHPLIFTPLKRLSGNTLTERLLLRAVKQDVAIYSAHTNLDVIGNGVSRKMAGKLGLKNVRTLSPLKNRLFKIVIYIPENHFDKVRDAVFKAGAGVIGNYDYCSFATQGTGSFRGGEGTGPFVGEKGKIHYEKEIRFETIMFSHLKDRVIKALREAHPYEEVAYDIYPLENDNIDIGFGCAGDLPEPAEEREFLGTLQTLFSAKGIRYSKLTGRMIKKVALCGGAGGMLINEAFASGADAYITADVRYHNFFDGGERMIIIDIGHYESEKFAVEILYDLIIKKFPTFALRFSEINTNPVNYFYNGKDKST